MQLITVYTYVGLETCSRGASSPWQRKAVTLRGANTMGKRRCFIGVESGLRLRVKRAANYVTR